MLFSEKDREIMSLALKEAEEAGKQGKAFVLSKGTELKEAIEIIHNTGGIAIVAHPWYLGENMLEILKEFVFFWGKWDRIRLFS